MIQLRNRRICLVSNTHLAANPRLVKEADALVNAGAQVTVVSAQVSSALKAADVAIAASRAWRCLRIEATRDAQSMRFVLRALRQKAAAQLPTPFWQLPYMAEMAYGRVTPLLASTLLRQVPDAELFIAHNLQALPAAARAAYKTGAALGFDLEDCHWGEFADDDHSSLRALVRLIEDRYLPRCQHLTAASPMIAAHYAERLGRVVTPVLNVFPLAERKGALRTAPLARVGGEPSLYWFSQTLGPGRGLEWVIAALRQLSTPVRLVLRGNPVPGYPQHLLELARGHALAERIRFEPIVAPDEVVQTCSEYDMGLSVEDGAMLNRRLCLANKIFHYMLAGLPVILSATPAQSALASELGDAAVVAPYGDAKTLAQAITPWLENPDLLRAARQKAWSLANNRYHWEAEQTVLQDVVQKTLDSHPIKHGSRHQA